MAYTFDHSEVKTSVTVRMFVESVLNEKEQNIP